MLLLGNKCKDVIKVGKEWLLLLVSIPFLVLLAYGYNILSSYFRYKSKNSTLSPIAIMEGYVGWTGMVGMLFILISRVLGLLGK